MASASNRPQEAIGLFEFKGDDTNEKENAPSMSAIKAPSVAHNDPSNPRNTKQLKLKLINIKIIAVM